MNVLILDGHSRAALESLQALGRAHVEVDLSSDRPDTLAFSSTYLRRRLDQPPTLPRGPYLDWLQDLDRANRYTLIIPSTEDSLVALNDLPENDPLRAKAVLPPRQSLDLALNKQKTYELAAALGIPVPRTRFINTPRDGAGPWTFPAVIKPVRSKVVIGGKVVTISAAVVSNLWEMKRYLNTWLRHTPLLESEYFAGHGIGIEMLYNQGKQCLHFAHERLHEYPLSGGASSYRRSIEPPGALWADAEILLGALRWHGVAMVEFKRNKAGDYRLMEINPRLWGSLALPIDAGVNFPLGLLALALGQEPVQSPYRVGYYTRNLQGDIDWFRENMRADPTAPLLMTRPGFRVFLELFRPLLGKESWDHFDWADPAVTVAVMRRIFSRHTAALAARVARKPWQSLPKPHA